MKARAMQSKDAETILEEMGKDGRAQVRRTIERMQRQLAARAERSDTVGADWTILHTDMLEQVLTRNLEIMRDAVAKYNAGDRSREVVFNVTYGILLQRGGEVLYGLLLDRLDIWEAEHGDGT